MLSHPEMLQLKRWNTPTIYNGWEQITRLDPAADGFNREEWTAAFDTEGRIVAG
jgi:4-hydroxy-4-methyl-2-oxoglutarate aldolase